MQYIDLVKTYSELEKTTKRLEKTYLISELLKKTKINDLKILLLLLQGRVFPQWDESKIGVASRLVIKAVNVATGISQEKIEDEWKKTGDLGLVAEKLTKKKQQATLFSQKLLVKKIYENIKNLTKETGTGAVKRKVDLIAELLTSAQPLEARYIVRTILEDLRVGVGEGSIRDAIVWAYFGKKLNIKYDKKANNIEIDEREEYNKYTTILEEAYNITNDFAEVAEIAKEKGLVGLKKVSLKIGKPIKLMLYQKAENIEDAFERVGKPAALEYKYDGFRLQIHRNKDNINLFTRRFENVSRQFPDVVKILRTHIKSDNYILDTEVIGIDPKTKKWLPFQNISQRIKRKYDIEQIEKDIPVIVNIFDAIQINNQNLLKKPFKERRELISKLIKEVPGKLEMAKQLITDSKSKAEKFYKQSLSKGNEGIMMKNLEGIYKPGSRVGYGVKVKPTMETLDLVIVGAEWGKGKRANWLSSFILACIDENNNFLEIGKVGTGIKEKQELGVSFKQLTKLLKPLIISEKGNSVKVKPKIVIEVNYEEIQSSNNYNSGFALRFPRLVSIREDRSPTEISILKTIKEYYNAQRHR